MKEKKLKKLARSILVKYHKKGKTADDTKVAMLNKGIPWGQCNSLYKQAAIKEGILHDPKRTTADIIKKALKVDFSKITEYHHVEAAVEKITTAVEGAEEAQVLRVIRKTALEQDMSLPKKTRAKGAGRVSVIPAAIVELVNSDRETTKQECYNTIVKLAKGNNTEATSLRYCNSLFPIASAVANGDSLSVTMSRLAGQSVNTSQEADVFDDDEDAAFESNDDNESE